MGCDTSLYYIFSQSFWFGPQMEMFHIVLFYCTSFGYSLWRSLDMIILKWLVTFFLFGVRLHIRTCQGRRGIGYPTPRRSVQYASIVFFLHVNQWWLLLNMAEAET